MNRPSTVFQPFHPVDKYYIMSESKLVSAALGVVGLIATSLIASRPNISMTCVMHFGTCETPSSVTGSSNSSLPKQEKKPIPDGTASTSTALSGDKESSSPIDPALKDAGTLRFENYQSDRNHK
jgi:hypothetical protein